MSKPFIASTVSKTLFGKNTLEITFVDQQRGTTQIVKLSPEARHRLMLALLARAPFQDLQRLHKEGEQIFEPENILNIVGVTSLLLDKDKPALELHLPQGMSVYLSFPPDRINRFQVALADLEKALLTSTTH